MSLLVSEVCCGIEGRDTFVIPAGLCRWMTDLEERTCQPGCDPSLTQMFRLWPDQQADLRNASKMIYWGNIQTVHVKNLSMTATTKNTQQKP